MKGLAKTADDLVWVRQMRENFEMVLELGKKVTKSPMGKKQRTFEVVAICKRSARHYRLHCGQNRRIKLKGNRAMRRAAQNY
jgi:hypothetical protein